MSASGPYWVLISQKNGSLLGPDLKAWGSLLVLETVGGSRGSRGRPTGFHGVKVRDELIASRNRMPIGLFRLSKKILYRTSNIEYLDILKTSNLFCLFSAKILRTFQKILRKFRKFPENSKNSPKILKIRQKFLKNKVFF